MSFIVMPSLVGIVSLLPLSLSLTKEI